MSETTKDVTESKYIYSPKVDIYEKDEEIILTAEIPGVSEGDVDITVEGDVLTLYAKAQEDTIEGYTKTYCEYGVGDYKRAFKLTDIVDRDQIGATLKNGILTIILHKAAKAKPQKIEVKIAA
ncbi:MAG: Hsp20/alpha crystallin family protein [Nitrospirae bacterium]|nr:Hsp20/alpha crystallin family protein [Nitrospirota bacterium]